MSSEVRRKWEASQSHRTGLAATSHVPSLCFLPEKASEGSIRNARMGPRHGCARHRVSPSSRSSAPFVLVPEASSPLLSLSKQEGVE